jgi:hypothetical protein
MCTKCGFSLRYGVETLTYVQFCVYVICVISTEIYLTQ